MRHRVAAAAGAVLLLLPPLRGVLEATMTTHLLVQLPLLVTAGVVLGRPGQARDRIAPWNPGGFPALLLGLALLATAMTPRVLDAAVGVWPVDVAKGAALVTAGALLARAWRALGAVGQAFVLGNALFMGVVGGLVLREAPVRFCTAYLAGDQRTAGTGLVLLAIGIGAAWLALAFRRPALLAGLLLTARPLAAQSDTAGRADEEAGALRLASGAEVALTLGGYLQVDGRWVSGALQSQPDGLLLRRARLVFDAAMPSGWHVRLQPDFGQGRVLVQDAFVGFDGTRATVRLGRFRPAFGVERFQSSATLLHGERSLLNSLMPSRSFGAQLAMRRGGWRVAIGGFRTPIGTDLQVVDTDGDVGARAGSGHDVLARVAWQATAGPRYLDAQVALLAGRERGDLDAPGVARLLTVGQQPLLAFRNDGTPAGTAVAAGARHRLSAGAIIGDARTMLAIEGALFTQRTRLAGDPAADGRLASSSRDVTAGAIAWRGAHLVGGTRRPTQEVVPHGARGALDVGARLAVLGVWGDDIARVITRRSITHATTGGVAVGWIPTTLTRLSLAYDITLVPPGGTIREHALLLRAQQGF